MNDALFPKDEALYFAHDVTKPVGVNVAMGARWWWCIDGDPKRALFYKGKGKERYSSPQCNSNKSICEHIPVPHTDAKLVFIDNCFRPWED